MKTKPPTKQIVPIRDKILIDPDVQEERTQGGIFLPSDSQEAKRFTGTVVAVGTGHVTDQGVIVPLAVKAGDRVLYSRYAGDEVRLSETGKSYILVTEQNIQAVLL